MKGILTTSIILLLVAGGAWYLWHVPRDTKPVPGTPALSTDLYPLYTGTEWGVPQIESFVIGTAAYSGTSVASSPVIGTMDPASVFMPFERYYEEKLAGLGWSVANDLAAGGHTGGQTGYRKGDATILTRFNVVYHTVSDDRPSECPCDVSLSLFSAGQ